MKTTHLAIAAAWLAALSSCALFRPHELTLGVTPAGAGVVNVSPERESYGNGERVTLTAVAADGYSLQSFVVDGALIKPAESVLVVVMDDDKVVEARFWEGTAAGQDLAYLVETGTGGAVEFSLSLGSAPADVYLALTNVGTANAPMPAVTRLAGNFGTRPAARPRSLGAPAPTRPVALRGHPITQTFQEEAQRLLARGRAAPRVLSPRPPSRAVAQANDEKLFHYDSASSGGIQATCRATAYAAGMRLAIWVADAVWNQSAYPVNQVMVDALRDRFLTNASTDIYGWMTQIFGSEWEGTGFTELIGDDNEISILLYDIDGDLASFADSGGVVGFFWSKDNFANGGSLDYSNERLMFYLDAPMLAAKDGDTWEITDPWPLEVVSTLAHEFQHMIHFYQKYVLRNASDPPWIDEMCSMVAEDLVSDKLSLPGPRGVLAGGGAGDAGNEEGWLPLFDYYTEVPVAYWPPENVSFQDVLLSYAVNYAFGAYLARNFGGAALFQAVVQTDKTGRAAVDRALSTLGYDETFESALRKWTVAVLLSDTTTAPTGYRYNTGDWIDAPLAQSGDYRLGSIDLYNYRYYYTENAYHDGPYVWSELPSGQVYASSTIYYLAATGATGTLTWSLNLDPNVRVQAVVKQ